MDDATRRLVRERALGRCEYCGLLQAQAPLASFHVEHVVARQNGGGDDVENLAHACYHCNLHKGPNLAGIDPQTGTMTALFNPRSDNWAEHFGTWGSSIVGLTPTGRVTVLVLAMNSEEMKQLRSVLT